MNVCWPWRLRWRSNWNLLTVACNCSLLVIPLRFVIGHYIAITLTLWWYRYHLSCFSIHCQYHNPETAESSITCCWFVFMSCNLLLQTHIRSNVRWGCKLCSAHWIVLWTKNSKVKLSHKNKKLLFSHKDSRS